MDSCFRVCYFFSLWYSKWIYVLNSPGISFKTFKISNGMKYAFNRSPWASVHTCWKSCLAGSCNQVWGPPEWDWILCWAVCTCNTTKQTLKGPEAKEIQKWDLLPDLDQWHPTTIAYCCIITNSGVSSHIMQSVCRLGDWYCSNRSVKQL